MTTEEQIVLTKVWPIFRTKLVILAGKTRDKTNSLPDMLAKIKLETFKKCAFDKIEAQIALDFLDQMTNTVITTKSLAKTISYYEDMLK